MAGANDEPPRVASAGIVPSGEISAAATETVATETEYRDAITAFNADNSGPHTISLAASINITGATDPDYTNATQPLTIEGNGFALNGGTTRRVLDMSTGQQLTLLNLGVINGFSSGAGGAIEADGSVVVENSTFVNNTSDADGGALDVFDDLTVINSTFVGNTSNDGEGGAVDTSAGTGADVEIFGSTFALNVASTGRGGAVSSEGLVDATNSTFVGNEAASEGGAISIGGQDEGEAAFTYVTFASNLAPTGAQYVVGEENSVALSVAGTVVTDPLGGGENCAIVEGSTSTSAYSYEQGGASCGFTGTGDTENGADPQLGALDDNGGPTFTMLPADSSPLVGAIPAAACVTGVTQDQRGVTRPQSDGCDIGAVEVEVAPLAPLEPPVAPLVEVTPRFTG